MAIAKETLKRKFTFKANNDIISLPDPNPDMTPEQVMMFYSNNYPQLTTSTVSGPTYRDDSAVYEFRTVVGTKG